MGCRAARAAALQPPTLLLCLLALLAAAGAAAQVVTVPAPKLPAEEAEAVRQILSALAATPETAPAQLPNSTANADLCDMRTVFCDRGNGTVLSMRVQGGRASA